MHHIFTKPVQITQHHRGRTIHSFSILVHKVFDAMYIWCNFSALWPSRLRPIWTQAHYRVFFLSPRQTTERLLKLDQKGRSLDVTGMSYSEFCHSVRCCAVLHGHLALEALPALKGRAWTPKLTILIPKVHLNATTNIPHGNVVVTCNICRSLQAATHRPPGLPSKS